MCTCIQNFDSVASHLELAILSRKFRTNEHAQWSAVEYFNFFPIEINLNLQDLYFHQVMGIMLQKQVIYWDFSIFRITTLDPCHRWHELSLQLSLLRAHSCFENVQINSTTITGTHNGSFWLLSSKTISVMDSILHLKWVKCSIRVPPPLL